MSSSDMGGLTMTCGGGNSVMVTWRHCRHLNWLTAELRVDDSERHPVALELVLDRRQLAEITSCSASRCLIEFVGQVELAIFEAPDVHRELGTMAEQRNEVRRNLVAGFLCHGTLHGRNI